MRTLTSLPCCVQADGQSLNSDTAHCPICAEAWAADRRTDYVAEDKDAVHTCVQLLRCLRIPAVSTSLSSACQVPPR